MDDLKPLGQHVPIEELLAVLEECKKQIGSQAAIIGDLQTRLSLRTHELQRVTQERDDAIDLSTMQGLQANQLREEGLELQERVAAQITKLISDNDAQYRAFKALQCRSLDLMRANREMADQLASLTCRCTQLVAALKEIWLEKRSTGLFARRLKKLIEELACQCIPEVLKTDLAKDFAQVHLPPNLQRVKQEDD